MTNQTYDEHALVSKHIWALVERRVHHHALEFVFALLEVCRYVHFLV
jgi:hypothetical protein